MTKQIMHVDDDSDTRKVVKTILQHHGYTVFGVSSGKECLKQLHRKKIDMILLDMVMPDMSGWDIFQKIKKNKCLNEIKVAFLSIIPVTEEKKEEMYKQGIFTYIMKPFTENELLQKLGEIQQHKEEKDMTPEDIVIAIQKHEDYTKIVTELILDIIILQTLEDDPLCNTMDITQELISQISSIEKYGFASSFFSNHHSLFQQKTAKKNLHKIINALLVKSQYYVGSFTLYPLLAKWEKYKFVQANTCGKTKLYEITKKGNQLKSTLLAAFVEMHKNEKRILL
jgi:CheY-like chemotaxis protein